ncbi:MAG TPA: FHA domain-containing protein [Polyangia bacterium]|nr:FHA domain-containing protein [Polyangia bacterium]
MAVLRDKRGGRVWLPEPDSIVGRSPRATLHLDEAYVSLQQASLRWTGELWELRDLGSRNGTFLDGQMLKPGVAYPLHAGSQLGFGDAEQVWVLEEDGRPKPTVVPRDGGSPMTVEGDLLGIPSGDDPQATIYRGADGRWILERPDRPVMTLDNGDEFRVGDREWRFFCPDVVSSTTTAHQAGSTYALQLEFAVSRDEEHVELAVRLGDKRFDLGSRGHNYLLLTLARYRLKDGRDGHPATSCGWVYQDDLAEELEVSPAQMNVDIFRIRKQFAALGLDDATNVIERRPRAKQLRIGVAGLEVRVL